MPDEAPVTKAVESGAGGGSATAGSLSPGLVAAPLGLGALAVLAEADLHEHEGGRRDEGEAHDHDPRGGGGAPSLDREQDGADDNRRQDDDDFANDPAPDLREHG